MKVLFWNLYVILLQHISYIAGWLLDLYGTYGYLLRQILQICILLIRRRDSRRNIRKNNISCKFLQFFFPHFKNKEAPF